MVAVKLGEVGVPVEKGVSTTICVEVELGGNCVGVGVTDAGTGELTMRVEISTVPSVSIVFSGAAFPQAANNHRPKIKTNIHNRSRIMAKSRHLEPPP